MTSPDKQPPMRILAVSPRFAPTNGADTHRLRLLLSHARAAGWEAEVLAVDSRDVFGPVDPWLEDRLPSEVPVHRVQAWSLKGWGLNGLAQRSFWQLYRKGCSLLATSRFDLVFFSTTEFALHLLGVLWHRKHGVRFCMDFQDPWVNDYYRNHPEVVPPGGRIKHAIADSMHRAMECYTVRRCAGFMAVSAAYLGDLKRRHGARVAGKPMLVRPFPAEPAELEVLRASIEPAAVEKDAPKVWRYIGRGGPDMVKTASAFFAAWEHAIADGRLTKDAVVFEAYGTSYAAAGRGEKTFEPLVEGAQLACQICESPDRLGYSDVLRALLRSDALVVFGSDDPTYTASKIYPYLLAGKPLIAIFHESSSVVQLMHDVGGGVCVTFDGHTTHNELTQAIDRAWFASGSHRLRVALDESKFAHYSAEAQAIAVGRWFRTIVRQVERDYDVT